MLNLFKFKIESDFLQNALWILQDALQFSINGGTKTNGLILNIVQAFCSGARVRYRRFEAGFCHPKLEQRPPAATDPSTSIVCTRRPLRQQSGPSSTMRTQVSISSIHDIFKSDFEISRFRRT